MNFGKIAWISVLTAWVLATLYGALLVTSAGNAESQDFGMLLHPSSRKFPLRKTNHRLGNQEIAAS